MLRRTTEPTYLRFELVRYARAHGIKPAARQFGTTVKTVRKWLRQWEPCSLRGLEDRSRAPLHPRCGITPGQRRRAVSLKRRKHKTKQWLREVKAAWRLFEQTCVDTKELCDIPELWTQARALGLPRYQYTAREVVSGWHYLAYAQECTLAYSKLFAEVILSHLQKCGVRLSGSSIQTDNGNEFVGNWQSKSDSALTLAVESVKGLVQRTPWELIHEREPEVDPAICALEPVYLDELFMRKLDAKLMWGYDVIPHP